MAQNTLRESAAQADARARILAAAGPVFAAKGFRAATVREICRKAAVNLASVNYYFGDKERLYVETVRYAHQGRAAQFPLPNWPEGTDPRQKLRDFVQTLLSRMLLGETQPWHAQLMLREVSQPTSACEELVRDYLRPHFEILWAILAELLPVDCPLEQRRRIIFSVIGQCLFYRVAQPVVRLMLPDEATEVLRLDALVEHIVAFSLAAIGQASPVVAASPVVRQAAPTQAASTQAGATQTDPAQGAAQ